MMDTLKNNKYFPTLFTNTAVDKDTNSPWWEGASENIPKNLTDWQGNNYDASCGKPAAHPNSRFTVSIYNCPSLAKEYDEPQGVPISGIIFGGRRKTNIPLVTESLSWENGVFAASIMGSETTSAAAGQAGVVRRDPMAMLPFCGYNMGDYFAHWLSFKNRAKRLPKIFMVNWFRKDKDGNFMWPGFRDNSRVIKWMIDRIENTVEADETPLGLTPKRKDLALEGLNIKEETLNELFSVDKASWKTEVEDIEKFYSQFGSKMPAELTGQLKTLKGKLGI
jgi:phosphoenolpyruvate carboxykinase (GTP)